MDSATTHPNEKTAQFVWTGFILSFFIIQAIVWSVAITVTARDSSHAVVAGYDEQALRWDDVKRLRQESARLGWIAQVVVDSNADIRNNRLMTIEIKDRLGQPVEGAKIELRAFHRGRAAKVQQLRCQEIEPGVYAATVRISKFGKWQFSGQATVGKKVFLVEQQLAVAKPKGK